MDAESAGVETNRIEISALWAYVWWFSTLGSSRILECCAHPLNSCWFLVTVGLYELLWGGSISFLISDLYTGITLHGLYFVLIRCYIVSQSTPHAAILT